jgi:hypothetical protein
MANVRFTLVVVLPTGDLVVFMRLHYRKSRSDGKLSLQIERPPFFSAFHAPATVTLWRNSDCAPTPILNLAGWLRSKVAIGAKSCSRLHR